MQRCAGGRATVANNSSHHRAGAIAIAPSAGVPPAGFETAGFGRINAGQHAMTALAADCCRMPQDVVFECVVAQQGSVSTRWQCSLRSVQSCMPSGAYIVDARRTNHGRIERHQAVNFR